MEVDFGDLDLLLRGPAAHPAPGIVPVPTNPVDPRPAAGDEWWIIEDLLGKEFGNNRPAGEAVAEGEARQCQQRTPKGTGPRGQLPEKKGKRPAAEDGRKRKMERRFCGSRMPRLCLVCGREGARAAYGGQACSSCRAFFQRLVVRGGSAVLAPCTGSEGQEGGCHIDSRSWRSCQSCRYWKCKNRAHMKEEKVVNAELPADSVSPPSSDSGLPPSPPSGGLVPHLESPQPPLTEHFLPQEKVILEGLYTHVRDSMVAVFARVYLTMDGLLEKKLRLALSRGAMSGCEFPQFELNCLRMVSVDFFSCVSDLQEVPLADRERLFAANFPLLFEIFYSSTVANRTSVNQYFRVLLEKTLMRSRMQELLDSLDLNLERLDVPALQHHQYYPRAKYRHEQDFARHRRLSLTLSRGLFEGPLSDETNRLDKVHAILVMLVVLFNAAGVTGLSSARVERRLQQAQNKYSRLLFQYLREKHEASRVLQQQRFASGMLAVKITKEIVGLKNNSLY